MVPDVDFPVTRNDEQRLMVFTSAHQSERLTVVFARYLRQILQTIRAHLDVPVAAIDIIFPGISHILRTNLTMITEIVGVEVRH
uniref:Hydantoinase_A domain-containing protein n=1 Tax=Panagrellus redivivus TaxID=6233 RepID=A0A7E4UWM0_PANRE